MTLNQQLTELLGFDPTKQAGVTKDGIQSVLEELGKERQEKAKAAAKELLSKAIDLAQKKVKAEHEFKKVTEAFDKELKKLLSRLNSAVNGKPTEEQEENQEQPKDN